MPRHPFYSDHPASLSSSSPKIGSVTTEESHGHRITFVNNKQDVQRLNAQNAAKHRHAIFSSMFTCGVFPGLRNLILYLLVAQRQQMSTEVICSVPNEDPGQILLDLERFEDSTRATSEFAFFAGPFGVSRFSPVPGSDVTSTNPGPDETSLLPENWMLDIDGLLNQDSGVELCDFFNTSDYIVSPNGPDPWELLAADVEVLDSQSDTIHPLPELPSITFGDNLEAWTILSHYKDRIVPLISPLGHGGEGPWASLMIPCAISTLGEVTMHEKAGHARLALLNSVLSTSAFHLGQHSIVDFEHWKETGDLYLKRAQHHFLQCIEEACASDIKKSKYKEILMAILSLSIAHVCTKTPSDLFDTSLTTR